MPESFEYAKNGGRKYLFHNLGNGKFEEVSEKVGINSRRWALAAAAADLRGTGHPDLFVANDYGVSELYFNDGKRFHEVGEQTGVGFAPKSGMNAAFGDILNQGRYAVYVSNISEDGILIQGNNLWVPKEGTSGDAIKYENLARDFGVELGGWSFGAQFGDLNNDGTLDLYLTNGYISLDRNRSYWYDFSKVAGGNSTIIGDAKNWPAFEGRSLSGYQNKRVWLNDGAGKFVDVAQAVGVTDTYDGRAVALADLWNRGVLDVVVANQNGPLLVYKNTVTPENEWIEFELEGTASNRSAIGAQVTLFWNGQQQVQEVSGGSGFAAQNQRRLHFGLGKYPQMEKAVIRWPSGKVQTIDKPAADQLHKIKEPHEPARLARRCHSPPAAPVRWKQLFSLDNRYIAPIFITCILLVGHLSFGILESYQKTLLAIVVSIATELALGRIFFHKWLHPASAYISGISVGILVRSPAFWPYALVQRDFDHVEIRVAHQRTAHLESIELRHLRDAVSGSGNRRQLEHSVGQLSVAHAGDLGAGLGDHLAPASLPYHRHLCSVVHRVRFPAQLDDRKPLAVGDCAHHRTDVSAFHFLHDHRSEDHGAIEEVAMHCRVPGRGGGNVMRMNQIVYAPFYALFIVGPTAMLIEIWLDSRRASTAKSGSAAETLERECD